MESQAPLPETVAAALERISGSKTFERAARHRGLLRHLIEKAAGGRAGEIKESTIALEVFARDSYDPQIDSQVRVEIGKLRERLERYYAGEGSSDSLRIAIPKGSYTPVFKPLAAARGASVSAPAPRSPKTRWPRSSVLRWALVVLVVAAASSFLIWAPWRSPAPAFRPSIAVLPFEDLSPAKDQEYFCSGMTAELIDDLTSLQIFRVLPRSSVAQYKGHPADVRKLGEQLKVQAVVEGTLRKENNRVRVSVQLLDTREGFQLWSKTYDRDFGNILEIQREISDSVVQGFHLDLPAARRALVRQRPRNSEAYLHYLRAANFYDNHVDRSVEFYRAAVAADPSYALAWAGLAAAWNRMVDWQMVPADKARPEATAAAAKAISINPRLAEAQYALGVTKLFYERNWRAAGQALLKAIELDPTDGEHRWEYGRLILTPTGRFFESADLMRQTIAIEPFKVALHNELANSLIKAGQGRYEEARLRFEEVARIRRSPWLLGHLGFTLSKLGRVDDARSLIAELEKAGASFEVAVVYAGLKEKDRAIDGLERAVASYSPSTLWIKVDYRLDELRGDSRFPALVKAVGLAP